MRILSIFLLAVAAMAGEASASSIVLLQSMNGTAGPSTVMVGPDGAVEENGGPSVTTLADVSSLPSVISLSGSAGQEGASIIVLGDPDAMADEEVAAPPQPTSTRSGMAPMPMIIRGGLVGEVSARAAPAGSPQASAPQEPPALDPNDKGTPAKRKALKRQQQRQLEEQASAPDIPEPAVPAGQ